MFVAQKLFCCGLPQPQDLLWYLRTGRSLSKDKDTDALYLKELNKLNTEKKFWIRFFTRNPIEITEITDDIAAAALAMLDEKNDNGDKKQHYQESV
ncbi:hypothetical protein GAMM_200040 [Gammaproteobacteria bacterium]